MQFKELKPQKDLSLHFIEISGRIRDWAAVEGVKIIPYHDVELPFFSRLKEKKKLEVLKYLGHQCDFFEMASAEGVPLASPQSIWRVLRRMNITPCSDLFDKIEDEDSVEIYRGDGTSFFKNLTFFRFISLSLEELYCVPWSDSMVLSPQLYLFLAELTLKTKLRELTGSFAPTFCDYTVGEKRGEKRKFKIHLKWVSPLRLEDGSMAVMTINRSAFSE